MTLRLIDRPADHVLATRVLQAKRAYTTRRVPLAAMRSLITDATATPQPGDLVLARVVRLGHHAALQGADGQRLTLFEGDEILVCYGARYAPDQFDAFVPDTLGPCHLVAGGGVAAVVRARHAKTRAATAIEPIGLVLDAGGRRVNLRDHALPAAAIPRARQPVTIASLGTSMNAGKTTSAAFLIRGLVRAGLRVAAAKVTGTGACGDPHLLRDAGAVRVLDFTDAGAVSTAGMDVAALEVLADTLIAHLSGAGVDAIVLEVADGLFQRETAALLSSPRFADRLDGVVFAAGDAMGAAAGAAWLAGRGLTPLALAGTLTCSPLAAREAAEASGLPVLDLEALGSADTARALWARAASARTAGAAA